MKNITTNKKKKILVTSAFPYANGPIHIGHLLEHIQTDIWVRTLRMKNHIVYYICADDTHGTPIMIKAEKNNTTPKKIIKKTLKEHKYIFKKFKISYNNYHSTNSNENKKLVESIFKKLKSSNLIEQKEIIQLFDLKKNMFLPDRFIKGTCPKCKTNEQYGDNCEICGATYNSNDLINPYSLLSNSIPIKKKTKHFFLKLSNKNCKNFIQSWINNLEQKEIINKLNEWINNKKSKNLLNWNISRDAPYFGFKIPNTDKYFYVWLDATIGYYSSFINFAKKKKINYNKWIKNKSNSKIYHFIGKDILYFHTIFWPIILKFSGYKTPTNIFVHGFLTIKGKKMSKSKGTFITAKTIIESKINVEWIRYYLATKLNSSIRDVSLNIYDIKLLVNSNLIGKYINIASRISKLLIKFCNGEINNNHMKHPLLKSIRIKILKILNKYENREYNLATNMIMKISNTINNYINITKPWIFIKKKTQKICSISLEAFRLISLSLKPILPKTIKKVEYFLSINPMNWSDINTPLNSKTKIKKYNHIMHRMTNKHISKLIIKMNTK